MAELNLRVPKFVEQGLRRLAENVIEPGQEQVGLGDVIHGATQRLGVKHCAKCAKRKRGANRRIAFGRPR